jgi:hypothetical protein
MALCLFLQPRLKAIGSCYLKRKRLEPSLTKPLVNQDGEVAVVSDVLNVLQATHLTVGASFSPCACRISIRRISGRYPHICESPALILKPLSIKFSPIKCLVLARVSIRSKSCSSEHVAEKRHKGADLLVTCIQKAQAKLRSNAQNLWPLFCNIC